MARNRNRAPGPDTQGTVGPGPDAAQAADKRAKRYALPVEPVFGRSSRAVASGSSCRGLGKVNREWSLICTGHSLLKLFQLVAGEAAR